MKWQNLQSFDKSRAPNSKNFFDMECPVSISLKDLLSMGQNWKKVHKSCKSRTNGIVGTAAASNICNFAQCIKQWKVMENVWKSCTVWKSLNFSVCHSDFKWNHNWWIWSLKSCHFNTLRGSEFLIFKIFAIFKTEIY